MAKLVSPDRRLRQIGPAREQEAGPIADRVHGQIDSTALRRLGPRRLLTSSEHPLMPLFNAVPGNCAHAHDWISQAGRNAWPHRYGGYAE